MIVLDSNSSTDALERTVTAFDSKLFSKTRSVILGKMGSLEARLAQSGEEIEAAQKLRYRVFVDEMGATLHPLAMKLQRDFDKYDGYCDHLLVIDRDLPGSTSDQIVGTYRLMRPESAEKAGGYYSQTEYDVASMIKRHQGRRFLELGRSCVLQNYRNKRSIELLWQGIWAFCLQNDIDVMFGCASFPGTIPAAHAQSLSFLHHYARADDEWTVACHGNFGHEMDFMPEEAIIAKQALSAMPPLVKGYLRIGALVSPQAFIDRTFNTTDILVILPLSRINSRYINYYGAEADRFVA